MGCIGLRTAKVAGGLFIAAWTAMPQAYTISAKPGAINYIEGNASLNGVQIAQKSSKSAFLNANDVLSTDLGKAEVLLSPGVFLRLGDNTQVRMISPSLTDTQVEVMKGEAMLEAAGLLKDNSIRVLSHGATLTVQKNGLYRISADDPPTAAVIDGKLSIAFEGKRIDLGKGKQTILSAELKPQKFDAKKADDLYAWSNVRSAYEAAASYQAARSVNSAGGINSLTAYGYTGGPGWMWNSAFNSWAWLPFNGAFYSPFGYGFYAPGVVAYAPVVLSPVYAGGRPIHGQWNHPGGARSLPVPVSPNNPPAVGTVAQSPWQYRHAQSAAARSFAESGFQSGTGAPVGNFSAGRNGNGAAQMNGYQHHHDWSGANGGTPGSNAGAAGGWRAQHGGGSAGGGGWSGQSHPGGGGWSGGHPGGGGASGNAGGGHPSGGVPSGGGGGGPRSR